MSDLRAALQGLVERPAAPPTPIELVAARGARFARHRRILRTAVTVAIVLVSPVVGVVLTQRGADPAQVVLAPEGPVGAGYVAANPGGYVATGTWTLTIRRGNEVIELRSPSSPPCGQIGTIRPGDVIRGSITGPRSSLRVGERFACPR